MDDVIILLTHTPVLDEDHVQKMQEQRRQIFCHVNSVQRAEFFSGGQSGLSPAFMFEVFPADYAGEQELEFHDVRYAVYRTFQRDADTLEVYAQREGGIT